MPDWIRTKKEDPNKLIEEFGMGKRQRKQVNYNDEFSEGQWLKIIEQGGDPSVEADRIRRKRAKPDESSAELPSKGKYGEEDLDDEELEFGAVSKRQNNGLPLKMSLAAVQEEYGEEDDLVMSEQE